MGNCFQKRRNGVIKSSLSARPLAFGGVWGTPEGGSPRITSHPLPTPPHQVSTYNAQSPRCEGEMIFSPHLKSFRFDDLKSATRNFRLDYLLGEGGFGYVYKGWLDKGTLAPAKPGNGIVVAVKKLKSEGFQGHKEWLSEVTYLGHLHHPNLVKLIGFCSEGENRLLVYEYMPGGSLENHLFRRGAHPLPWALRIKVAIEAARGLSFLHCLESQVIYRDFKSSNVLLDMDYNAKLSDFGLAKAGPTGDLTHVTTQVMGTQGYTAPEYVATGRLTAKCDVYSFGIVLLELITGRRALDKKRAGSEQKLLEWVKPQLCDAKKLFRIMDSKLEGQYPRKGAYIVANLALQCAHLEARYRPQMSDILSILEKLPIMPNAIPSSISNPQNRELDHHHPKKKPKNHCHHHRHHSHGHHHHPLVNWSPQGSPLMPHRCLSSHVKTLQGQ